jgi:isopentenyldiphosphate isomerase
MNYFNKKIVKEFITMEIWDILDENGNLTGRTIIRGEEIKKDEYHLVVHIWIINSNGDILIQKRPNHLEFAPGVWATTGGSAIQGEDSITAACRETKEELGIEVNIDSMLEPLKHKRKNDFTDIWVVKQDIELEDIILQKEEVDDVKWVNAQELKQMINEGSFFRYSDDYFKLLSQYIQI